jgi:hypothetical protein
MTYPYLKASPVSSLKPSADLSEFGQQLGLQITVSITNQVSITRKLRMASATLLFADEK